MRTFDLLKASQCEKCTTAELIVGIATSKSDVTLRSASALAQVCRDVITGEGPTVAGRVHFSRTIDVEDAALCAQILVLAGRHGDPVSRAEADALFDIGAAAGEHSDHGRFNDLLAKAVVHHVMSAFGLTVPRREIALATTTPLNTWASVFEIDPNVRSWLDMRTHEMRPDDKTMRAIAEAITGMEQTADPPVAIRFDLAA